MSNRTATRLGFGAILLWSTLGLLTAIAGPLPPFQMVALTFSVSAVMGLIGIISPGPWGRSMHKYPLKLWGLGLWGLFGYHFFYFLALGHAPAVEANLINYLWPLLIVLFSGLLPNEHLSRWSIIGVVLGFIGAASVVVTAEGSLSNEAAGFGYFMAVMAALAWSSYSVLSRHFAHIGSDAVAGFCLLTAISAWACHISMETWVAPSLTQYAALTSLGLGPVGLAFFLWDRGMKRGDIQLLGTLSYLTPLLSTLLLISFGHGQWRSSLLMAALLIVSGAFLASKKSTERTPPTLKTP
ncbi:aromatic amino acid exporter YddG [Magnetococcus sp. PR-3]|uniref:aromatic amino acid exporter YddG n=1 Tax=Magnetococcus sp. PR-3 TaxID=3120355 RepID=UPI002FCE4A11